MLLKLSILFLIVFVVSVLVYILAIKFKKESKVLRRISGLLSLLAITASIVFIIIYIKANNIKLFNRLKSYDVNATYTATLKSQGKQQAYSYLPIKVYAQKGEYYFINSLNDVFKLQKNKGKYTTSTHMNETTYISGNKTLNATISDKGELTLDGYLLYSKYDSQYVEYKNKVVAKNVQFCNFTSNSLFYITNDGALYGLGFNEYGQLGDTTTKNKAEPELIRQDVSKASVSDTHALIVDKFGTLYAVGDNSYSQLGNKNAISSTEPTKIMRGVKDVRVGNYFSVVLTVNGEVYTAGKNDNGQLGNGGQEFKAELIMALKNVEKIEINGNTCAALTHSGELYTWGDNKKCKAGIAADKGENILTPTKVKDNVYDFALSDSGIILINKDRDILISDDNGVFETASAFGAQIPENLKDKNADKYKFTEEKV